SRVLSTLGLDKLLQFCLAIGVAKHKTKRPVRFDQAAFAAFGITGEFLVQLAPAVPKGFAAVGQIDPNAKLGLRTCQSNSCLRFFKVREIKRVQPCSMEKFRIGDLEIRGSNQAKIICEFAADPLTDATEPM